MLSTDQIRDDDSWREELNERFGWMGGKHGLDFECRGGWRFILRDLLQRISATLTDEEKQDFQVGQIKEKYSTLRFSSYGGSDRIDALVDAAERASEVTCEICGGMGRVRREGWLTVRCDVHVDYRPGE